MVWLQFPLWFPKSGQGSPYLYNKDERLYVCVSVYTSIGRKTT